MKAVLFCSQFDGLDLVVDLVVERVVITDERVGDERQAWGLVLGVSAESAIDGLPSAVELSPVILSLLDGVLLALFGAHV